MPTRLLGENGVDHPYIPPRNPFQVFLLMLSCLVSLGLIQGNAGSVILEEALTDRAVTSWGWALMVGSAMSLIGLWLPERFALFGLALERAGMILVGGAAAIYAYVLWDSVSDPVTVAYNLAIQIAFALACVWRMIQLTRVMRWAVKHAKEDSHWMGGIHG
jgi:hypothetical protein